MARRAVPVPAPPAVHGRARCRDARATLGTMHRAFLFATLLLASARAAGSVRVGTFPQLSLGPFFAKRPSAALLDAIAPLNRGIGNAEGQQAEIVALVDDVIAGAPRGTAATDGTWELIWTTEKEVLFLLEKGLFGCAATTAVQVVDLEAGTLNNIVNFEKKSQLKVDSSAQRGDGNRVDFAFNGATLKYRGFALPVPPVGKGWFDSYVDGSLRIAKDSRGDTAIYRRI